VLGFAFLTRPEGLLLGLAIAAAMVLDLPRTEPVERSTPATRAITAGVLVLALGLVAAPWVGFVSAELGQFSLGEKASANLWREYRDLHGRHFPEPGGIGERAFASPELARTLPASSWSMLDVVRAEPGAVASRIAARFVRIVTRSIAEACYWPFVLIALGGIAIAARPSFRPALAVLVAMPLLYAPFSDDRRFFVPLVPIVVILGAAAIERLRRPLVAHVLVAALAVGFGAYDLLHPLTDSAPEHRAAGVWLRQAWKPEEAGRRPIVMSRKSWVAFYAGGLLTELPEGGLDSVLARAARRDVDVLVVDERWAVRTRPELAPLLDPGATPRGWTMLRRFDGAHPLVIDVPADRAGRFSRSGSSPRRGRSSGIGSSSSRASRAGSATRQRRGTTCCWRG
jgi:hypothetical protein